MPKFLRRLLMALGLIKRPLPERPPAVEPLKPEPVPDTLPAPKFHGFFLQQCDYVNQGELVILQVTPQIAGCGAGARRFGIEANGSGPYEYKIEVVDRETGHPDRVYNEQRLNIAGEWFNDWRVFWYPLGELYEPTAEQHAIDIKACERPRPYSLPEPKPAPLTKAAVDLWIRNAHGNTSHWKQEIDVVKHRCRT